MVSSILFFIYPEAKAHPGNTDSFGKHTCRTNCKKWVLEYGVYHGHSGGDSSSDSTNLDDVPVMTKEVQ